MLIYLIQSEQVIDQELNKIGLSDETLVGISFCTRWYFNQIDPHNSRALCLREIWIFSRRFILKTL